MLQSVITSKAQSTEWWLNMNLYQIYVRSFADSNGDGVGDIAGITQHLQYLADLGINAIWLTPFYPSPQADMGYDVADYRNVDPTYGTLDDFDAMVAKAHSLNVRVFIDIVPNHTSSQHPWFQAALKAAPGSAERNRYIFVDGRDGGKLAPNAWGGWTTTEPWTKVDTQWYLHMFSAEQPDLNWRNPEVREEFKNTLRFWMNRGVDGLRVDAPTLLIKPELTAKQVEDNLPDLFPIYAEWRTMLDEEFGPRCMIGEVFDDAETGMENFVDKAHMNQIFCFDYQEAPWQAGEFKDIIDSWVTTTREHGSSSVWVSSSHDLIRQVSYLGFPDPKNKGSDIGPEDEQPDLELGTRRTRAMTLMTMWLPGAICTYYGEELGLPDHTTLTDADLQGRDMDRDGCRSPMPWMSDKPNLGFSTAARAWLPLPQVYRELAVDVQQQSDTSMLSLYRVLFKKRQELGLAAGDVTFIDTDSDDVIVARNGNICLAINFGDDAAPMPAGEVIAKSLPDIDVTDDLPANAAVWLYQDWAVEDDDDEDDDEDNSTDSE